MRREIVEIGHPALRGNAEEVPLADISSQKIQRIIDDLIETKRAANGAGLAAPQIAVPLRVFLAEVTDNPRYPYKPNIPLTIIINPKITFLTEKRIAVYEGCLSVPNLRGVVERCPEVRVDGLDRNGEPLGFVAKGISAGTFQHENDHLDGILFLDRVKDAKTFCTWKEFALRHEDSFSRTVKSIVEEYGC